ncbi:hypothetical protein GQX74_013368 [Glossina fuscipes]|nr:hypothetical protein GQX74_013368 [Glossina fuscipes]
MKTLVQHSTVLMTTLLYETYITMSCKVFAGLSNKNLGTKNLIRPKSTISSGLDTPNTLPLN